MGKSFQETHISRLQRRIFRSAFLTSAFTEFITIVALTIDSVIVCNFLGEKEIAAVGIASPFFFLSGIPATCIASGLQTRCTLKLGRGKTEEVNRYFRETFIFTACLMAVFTAIVFIAAPQLAFLFGARGKSAELAPLAVRYLRGLAFDAAPFVLMSVTIPVVILDNGSRIVMVSSAIGGIVNILFDLISIKAGWGLTGIGLASSLSAVAALGVLLTHFFGKNNLISFGPIKKIRMRNIRYILRLGFPNAVHAGAGMLRVTLLNTLAGYVGGSIGVSVMTIHGTIMDFVDILAVGIAGAVGILTGIAYGEYNGEGIEKINRMALRYIAGISALGLMVIALFGNILAGLFLKETSEGFGLLLFVQRCIAVGIFFNAVIYVRVSYLQAIKQIRTAQILETLSNLVVLMVFALLFSQLWGIQGLFAAFPASKAAICLMILIRYIIKTGKPFVPLRDYLDLDEKYYSDVKNVIAYSFTSIDDCVLSAEQIQLFCKGHRLDPKTQYMASLCAEEVMTNIVRYSGTEGKRIQPEIRVTIVDDKLILRVRDCGTAFNLKTVAAAVSSNQERSEKIGLRFICAAASKISYYRIFGMNTTIIEVKAKHCA